MTGVVELPVVVDVCWGEDGLEESIVACDIDISCTGQVYFQLSTSRLFRISEEE